MLAAEANGRTRLVVNVDPLLPYTTKVDGNTIIVTLGRQPRDAAAAAAVGAFARRRLKRLGAGRTAISTIDFRRGSDGTGRVIVQLPIRARRSTCARKATRWWSTSPAR